MLAETPAVIKGQINGRKKYQFNYIWESHKDETPKAASQLRLMNHPEFQREEGNSQEGEKRKCRVSKVCPAWQLHLSDETVIFGNSSLSGDGGLSNVKFPYKRITSLFLELLLCLSFFKKDNPHTKQARYRMA